MIQLKQSIKSIVKINTFYYSIAKNAECLGTLPKTVEGSAVHLRIFGIQLHNHSTHNTHTRTATRFENWPTNEIVLSTRLFMLKDLNRLELCVFDLYFQHSFFLSMIAYTDAVIDL